MDPAQGGLSQAIRSSVADLENLGVSTEVVSCDAPGASWLGKDSFPVHTLGPGKFGYGYTPNLEPWLHGNLSRFDAVIIDGLWQWPSVCATRAVARERALRTRAEAGDLRPEAKTPKDRNTEELKHRTKQLRCFVMPHGMLDPWFQRDRSRRVKAVRNWFYWWLVERGVVNSADALLFTCQQELELARTTFGGYRPKKEVVVGLGIEEPPALEPKMQEVFAARCPDLHGRPYLLFMSRVHPKKGVDLLVRAYARVRAEHGAWSREHGDGSASAQNDSGVTSGLKDQETKRQPSLRDGLQGNQLTKDLELPDLVVAGPGWDSDYGREVRGLIDEANRSIALTDHRTLNTEHSAPIHSVDMLSGAAKWGALYGCEAFVLPSHQENFGIAVVEALACGKPVLISDQVNIWREISDADAGLVEADTEDGAVRLLKRFTARKDAPKMAERARECYLSRFAIGPAASNFAQVLKYGAINPS
jgi:glycosyltransferase involved in cell wall biosynthesis